MFRIEIDNINGKTKSLYAYGNHSILIELEQQNVLINHSCRQGHCGSCILQLLSGDVTHQDSIISLSQGKF